ncbi:MAG: hypothetical protein PHE17_11280 [Thiothrix sp.]|uniref:hypothetical protein n=1 Tax=Thiothrix sp. TaxID=1032 RepID=UPI002605E13B|nr:hypothetical protein [Thiothrix sp.]MDD5393590.1 hypothetical protein [Thiothrix sp.]
MSNPVHVTFIHGLANKPSPSELKRIWLEALSMPTATDQGFDLGESGVTTSFVYWADLFYATPLASSTYESLADDPTEELSAGNTELSENDWTRALHKRFPEINESPDGTPESSLSSGFERIPLPAFLKNKIMAEFMREAHDYLFNVQSIRDIIRTRVINNLREIPVNARKIIVGHSQGSFIAYDVMTGVNECPLIDSFMTIGSPLGIDEIQDKLIWTRDNGFPVKLRGDWVNIYDPLDMVARPDPRLANDFRQNGQQVVIDIRESNQGTWRHSSTKYLKGTQFRQQLRRLCQREV